MEMTPSEETLIDKTYVSELKIELALYDGIARYTANAAERAKYRQLVELIRAELRRIAPSDPFVVWMDTEEAAD